jgi:hypothetical protein
MQIAVDFSTLAAAFEIAFRPAKTVFLSATFAEPKATIFVNPVLNW